MAQPDPYDRDFDFEGFQSGHPSTPLPGDKLNIELDAVSGVVDEILARIADLQRDDLEAANALIGYDQLKPELRNGFSTPTVWATATAYALGASVYLGRKVYAALSAHTSGTFAVDLAAGKWYLLADFTEVTAVDQAAAEAALAAAASAAAALASQSAAAASAASTSDDAAASANSAAAALASENAAAISAAGAAQAVTDAIGVTVQAHSANLDDVASVVPGATGLDLLADTTADAALTTLGFGAAGKAIAADATQGDVRDYISVVPRFASKTLLKAADTAKDIVADLKVASSHKGYRRYEFRSGDYSTKHAGDGGLDCGYIKADAIALTSGCWVLAPEDPDWVDFEQDFEAVGGASVAADPATYAGYHDNTPNFNAVLNYCESEDFPGVYLPRASFFFKSKPTTIDFPLNIRGAGRQTTSLVRAYDEADTTLGLLTFSGNFAGEGTKERFTVIPAHTTTGGHAISYLATSSTNPQNVRLSDIVLTHLTSLGGTWHSDRALYMDGTPKITGSLGIRDTCLENVTVFGKAYFAGLVGLTWEGGLVLGGGASAGLIELSGVSAVVSQYININIGSVDGFAFTGYVSYATIDVGIIGSSGVTNVANTTFVHISAGGCTGTVEENWNFSSFPRRIQTTGVYDPPSLINGARHTQAITVTGSALGDMARATYSLDLQGITMDAWVSSAGTVTVLFQNNTGGTIDLATGTIKVWVDK